MITTIKNIIQGMGLPFRYGNPSQINRYLQDVDYSAATDGIAAYCYLITESTYENGKERATLAVFFSKLMPFDFNGDQAVQVTDACKAKAKEFLHIVEAGNQLTVGDIRLQYGYDDFAENVGWCALRATFGMAAADCVPWKTINVVIPVLIGGGGITPQYVNQILALWVFTNSDTIYGDAKILIDGVEVDSGNIAYYNADEITTTLFPSLPQEYQQYYGHIGYLWMIYSENKPATLQAVIGGRESEIVNMP